MVLALLAVLLFVNPSSLWRVQYVAVFAHHVHAHLHLDGSITEKRAVGSSPRIFGMQTGTARPLTFLFLDDVLYLLSYSQEQL